MCEFQFCADYIDLNASQLKEKIHWEYCHDNWKKKKKTIFLQIYTCRNDQTASAFILEEAEEASNCPRGNCSVSYV